MSSSPGPTRYRFADFTVNESTRILSSGQDEIALIPRYFDLLVLLLQRRPEAVTREEIFEHVWKDVIVSDGALTQAIRTLRKCLGDPARDPRFIRTVSRHGYRFVFEEVREEPARPPVETEVALETAIEVLRGAKRPVTDEDEARIREAAETVLQLHDRNELGGLSFNEVARAHLRDARWDIPGAPTTPLGGLRGGVAAARALIELRARHTWRLCSQRWLGATFGGAAAGAIGGVLGALALLLGPGSQATPGLLVALPLFGIAVGGMGAAGVAAGLSSAEALVRSFRRTALIVAGAAGGGLVGAVGHFVGRYTVEGLFGRDLSPVGGGFEGLVLGAAVGAGYALATPIWEGGMATPRGALRLRAAAIAGICCGVASILLAATGHHLGAMSLDFMAQSFPGSQVSIEPLAGLLGESEAGPWTRSAVSGAEGLLFGTGLVFGLTRRPLRNRRERLQPAMMSATRS